MTGVASTTRTCRAAIAVECAGGEGRQKKSRHVVHVLSALVSCEVLRVNLGNLRTR